MIRKVRRKLASKVSKIEQVDDFNFGNWLKVPLSEEFQIGSIHSRLKESFSESIEIPAAETFNQSFDDPEVYISDEIKTYRFNKVRSNAVFFMMHQVTDRGINLPEIEPKPLGYSARNVDFLINIPSIKDVRVKFATWAPQEYKCRIDLPEIFDYLSEMTPVVYNIDLLNLDTITETKNIDVLNVDLDSLKKSKVKKISLDEVQKTKKIYKIKIPSIGSYKSSQKEVSFSVFKQPKISEAQNFTLPVTKNWFAKVQLPQVDSFVYFSQSLDKLPPVDKKIKELRKPSEVRESLKSILSTFKKADWKERKDLHIQLRPYEESGAKYLVEHDHALLQDEFGIDKEKEVIAALKFLFGNRSISSALIVSASAKKGNIELSNKCNIEIGWSDKLNKYCPEIPITVIEGDNDQRADLWAKSASVFIADHKTVLTDYRLKILEEKYLNKFDCIIFDEVHLFLPSKEMSKDFLASIRPRVLWATSGIISKDLQQELNSSIDSSLEIKTAKIRSKESIIKDAPRFIWHEEWIKADEDQLKEFKVSLVECQKDLRRVLESGNPFRFTANIFTLIHRLKQVCNFAPGNSKSPKTELLLEHVSTIKANGKKVIILSQYDRLGTKKIEKIFEQNDINYILVPGGMAIDEVKKAVSLFKSKKEIVALITDAKTSKLNFAGLNVPYVIRFDQWWNPTATWELEDMFLQSEDGTTVQESINVYDYHLAGSMDESIRQLLNKKEILNKNIFELMPLKVYDELISVDEWLRLFNMPSGDENYVGLTPEKVLEQLNTSTLNFFRTILSKFFFKLGYSHVDIIDLPNSSSFNVVGEAVRNNRKFYLNARIFLDKKIDKKTVEEIVMETADSGNTKVFVITKGAFQSGCEKLIRENVTLLDGISLAKYLLLLEVVTSQTTDPAQKLFA